MSHDCDVTQESLQKEPTAEVVLFRQTRQEKPDGLFVRGRNPREIDMADAALGTAVYRVRVHERWQIPREELARMAPVGRLSESNRLVLAQWLAARYVRSAFPDAFNERIRPANKAIARVIRSGGERVTGIYLLLTPEELPPQEDYRIAVKATVTPEDFADPQLRAEAQMLVDELEGRWGSQAGVVVVDAAVVPENDFTLDDLTVFRRWDPYDWTS